MRRIFNTLAGRLVALQLLLYAVLLPVLFYRLDALARANAISTFTQHTRAYGAAVARELELGDVLESASRTIAFLDGSVESGTCLYAAVKVNGRLIGSSVVETPATVQSRGDDGAFSASSDSTYAVAIPVRRHDRDGALYLGFDKRPTLRQLQAARTRIVEALLFYGAASVLAAVLLARLVSAPLTQLRAASRRVARGDASAHLSTSSTMAEIRDLSSDLELMRGELVGSAQQLRDEIQRRQLEQAERAALEGQLRHEQRLATVGTFASGLAHEFNNILVPLMLYTEESLEEVGTQQPVRTNLERILRAATRAGSVVSKLLAFSRPIAESRPEAVNLGAVINEALDLFQALIPANVELKRQVMLQGERVLGDPTLLNQVVLNLCSNAVRAMRERGGTLTVTLAPAVGQLPQRSGGATTVVALSVKDTGHGMDAATRERIFEPFFTTGEVGEGSGLGLSIVHGIIMSIGGSISVASAIGVGTQVTVELPVLPSAELAAQPLPA